MSSSSVKSELSPQPDHEEFANALTHGVGLALACVGSVVISWTLRFPDRTSAIAFAVYSATLVAVYAVSACSHAIQQPQLKYRLRVWDQGLIYLLIAGTYTPLICAHFGSGMQTLLLSIVWGFAILGFASKIWKQHRINRLAVLSYLMLGWIPACCLVVVVQPACFAWILGGGTSYTLGTYFLKRDRLRPYYHALWHTSVMVGSVCHFIAIANFAILPSGT